jgi:hypothetical protein
MSSLITGGLGASDGDSSATFSGQRLDAEIALHGRWAGLLDFVYQRPAEADRPIPSTNRKVVPDASGPTELYNDPLGFAISLVGRPSATPNAITDSDVGAVAGRWFMFLDLAEYRLIRSMLGSFTDIDQTDNGRTDSYARLADRAQERADNLMEQYKQFLTPFRGGASSGAIRFVPPTSHVPRYGPGYGGPSRGRWGCW